MRIDTKYGSDTGLSVVDVYLESDREAALSHREVWAELRPRLAAERVDVADVVDFFLYRRGPGDQWISAGLLPWDAQ